MVEFLEGLAEALSPYVRALAWWHAVPQPPPSKLKGAPKAPPNRQSRMAARLAAGGEPDLPELDPSLAHVVAYLFDAGPTSAAGQYGSALSWADLQAWQAAAGIYLPPWQLRLLRRLSGEYLSESFIAEAWDAPPPWERDADRAKVAAHVRKVLRN